MVVVVGEIIIGNPLSHYPQIVEMTSLLNVAFYVLSQSTVRNHVFATQITSFIFPNPGIPLVLARFEECAWRSGEDLQAGQKTKEKRLLL